MPRALLRRPCPFMQIASLPLRRGSQLAFFRGAVLGIAWLVAVSGANAADEGAVCIADVPAATPGRKSLHNATASEAPYDFTVRIGDRPAVATSPDRSVLVQGLATSAAHRLVIKRNGKPFALLVHTEPSEVEATLRAHRAARFGAVLARMQQHARETGADQLTETDIQAEVDAARTERRLASGTRD